VLGRAYSPTGWGGVFIGGYGLYAQSSEDDFDIILGGTADTTPGDDGKITSDPAYPSSDVFLFGNDDVVVRLDTNEDEEGSFEVRGDGGIKRFFVGDDGYTYIQSDSGPRPHLQLVETEANDWARLQMRNNDNTDPWTLAVGGTDNAEFNIFREDVGNVVNVRSNGRVGFNRVPGYPIHVGSSTSDGNGAHLTTGGAWTNGSSREFKKGFQPVDPSDVLDRVAELPISTWQYKGSEEGKHMGPMAEDFAKAFGLGSDEQYITTIDADGVALAAIQGLYQLVQEQHTLIEELHLQVAELQR
jgi:hypothetical protein